MRDHGACVVALTIDEKGMANTADRKLEVATRIRDIACDDFGLQPHQLLFDALTFTLATGEKEYIDSAHQTIDGIRRIKETLPGVLTVLGLSNVSFGSRRRHSRPALNSVFLYHCVQAGLDAAIVNPAHITPVRRDRRRGARARRGPHLQPPRRRPGPLHRPLRRRR